MELLTVLLTHLPIVDLLMYGLQTTASTPTELTQVGYDIGQFLMALKGVALGIQQFSRLLTEIARRTDWAWDDGIGPALLSYSTFAIDILSSIIEWVATNMSTVSVRKGK